MSFLGESHPQEWTAVMPGDLVRDAAGNRWGVTRIAPDGAGGVWAELNGGALHGVRTLHVPSGTTRVELAPGPGWGPQGDGDAALSWAVGLVTEVLGGTVVRT